MCSDFALLGERYMAACVEVRESERSVPHEPFSPLSPPQSLIVVYDLESGQKRLQMPVEGGERGVVLVRHLLPLQETQLVCSSGRDLHILHSGVKQKVD